MKVIVQKWEESERGWGVRPDGYSLHRTEEDRAAYVKAHWDSLPDEAPDEYSRPSGSPYEADVTGDAERLLLERGSFRTWDNKYPGDGGPNGWVNRSLTERDRNG